MTRREPSLARKRKPGSGQRRNLVAADLAKLDRLIEEATADCHNESEQVTGLYTMLEDNLELPFEAQVLGVPVTVQRIDLTDSDEIVAICIRGRARQAISILDLPLPVPPPRGAEWIEAYRRWAREG